MPIVTKSPVGVRELYESQPNSVQSGSSVSIGTGNGSKILRRRVAMRFTNVKPPANHEIASAVLRLNVLVGLNGPKDIAVNRIATPDQDWDPDESTWNNKDFGVPWGTAGGNPDGAVEDVLASATLDAGTLDIPIPTIAADIQDTGKGTPYQADIIVSFDTENDDSALLAFTATGAERPRLIVDYQAITVERRGGAQPFVPTAGGWLKRGRDGE
jgi:hypothetical protein